jgi:hypothetical protein
MALEIQVLAWDRHNNVAELNQLMGYQPLIKIQGLTQILWKGNQLLLHSLVPELLHLFVI